MQPASVGQNAMTVGPVVGSPVAEVDAIAERGLGLAEHRLRVGAFHLVPGERGDFEDLPQEVAKLDGATGGEG